MKRYITLSISIATHEALKRLAKQKGVSMAKFIDLQTHYFSATCRDPEDIAPISREKTIEKLKKDIASLLRINKSQEQKLLAPTAETVLSMEKTIVHLLKDREFFAKLREEVACPSCQGPYRSFSLHEDILSCYSCGLSFRTRFGNEVLGTTDIAALLSGGMTRVVTMRRNDNDQFVSGRYVLDPAKNYELRFHPLKQ